MNWHYLADPGFWLFMSPLIAVAIGLGFMVWSAYK